MSQMYTDNSANSHDSNTDDLEKLLIEGVRLENVLPPAPPAPRADDHEDGDVQGAIGLFAEAAQDMATAGVELGLGRHFACADSCNQAAEKAAQAVSLLRFARKTMYNHDLRTLGEMVGAPPKIQDDMAALTPFHPEAFYANTPPEEADEIISAEQATTYMQCARRVLRWARNIVLAP
ncbi:MAG: HEPN domain-containing protein [Ktedonobacteraceae bacterium]